MPVPQLRNLAKKYGVSVQTAERAWNACKAGVDPDSPGHAGYGVVFVCTRRKLAKMKKGA